ncbi:hypothetical protein O181_115637 [Austropuccinia psidii MF-1]|uniref:Uncharacterized protein n=1 Tax=Austropuccinia psidii MF-1 TaxID=1389203 RepID=A0A9Q3K7W3_9BASI|nr:hypothetical protein [Austropuccinia psidii MF-1]
MHFKQMEIKVQNWEPQITPERQTRSHARAQAVLAPTPRVPLDSTPEVPQLRAQLDRGNPIYKEQTYPGRREEDQEDKAHFQE